MTRTEYIMLADSIHDYGYALRKLEAETRNLKQLDHCNRFLTQKEYGSLDCHIGYLRTIFNKIRDKNRSVTVNE